MLPDILKVHQAATERNDAAALAKVEKAYLSILEIEPDHAEVLQLLGTLYMQINKNSLAIQIFERCLTIKPTISEAWNNLGNAYRIEHHTERAEKCYAKAVECAPNNGENWNNWGTNHVNEGSAEEGERILRRAVELNPENPHSHWNLSLVLLEQGKYKEGFALYDWGKKAGIRFERFYDCPEWDGKPTDHLILYGEQGIGDEIMYMSLVRKITNVPKITVDGHPRLINMMRRNFPHINFQPTRKERVIRWANAEKFTARMALGDLGKFYIETAADFDKTPYLRPDKTKLLDLPPGINVGISWEGGRKKTRNDQRSMGLEQFLPLIKAEPGYNWISLQYTPKSREVVQAFNKKHGTNIVHYSAVHEGDYDHTLSLASQMDLVITVNTSLVHLCGAAGIRALVLTPYCKAWRYHSPNGDDMAWYGPHIKLLQQGKDKDWAAVLRQALTEVISLGHKAN